MENNLNWQETLPIDESIEKLDYHDYEPHQGIDLNKTGDIRITIQNQDQFILPSKSYLHIEGKLEPLREGLPHYNVGDEITLINNGLMYLFDRIDYLIANERIEGYNNPGVATTMKSLLTYPKSYSEGMTFLWSPDTDNGITDNKGFAERNEYILANHGSFSAAIPLSHMFGFCENYDKVIYGVKHEINLHKRDARDAVFKSNEREGEHDKVSYGRVVLSKISWQVPFVKLSDQYKLKLYKAIDNKVNLSVAYLNRQCETYDIPRGNRELDWRLSIAAGSEKPRYVFLAFQTDKDDDQEKNPALFDHCYVRNAYVQLNSERYPERNLNLNFGDNNYITAYKMLVDYYTEVLGKESCAITLAEFKDLYPILIFDISHQSERLKNSVTDIKVKASFDRNIPNKTKAYALILSDRLINLKSDGNKMNIVY